MKNKYIFKIVLFFLLAYSSSTSGQQNLIQNGGFDNIDPSCGSANSYGFAFNQGCLGPEWGASLGTPSVKNFVSNPSDQIPPVSAPFFTYLYAGNNVFYGCKTESFFYNISLEQNKRYQLSIYVRRGITNSTNLDASAQLEIYAANGLANIPQEPWEYDCDANPPFSAQQIHIEQVNEVNNPDWKLVTFCFTVYNDYDQIWVKPYTPPHPGGVDHWNRAIILVDDMSLVELSCEETAKLTACVEEEDYGYIALDCEGDHLSYYWNIPFGSTAMVSDDNILFNASPGIYTVIVTNLQGCLETITYEIFSSCCDTTVCETPINLECRKNSPQPGITLSWEEVTGATDYIVTITKNDNACGCFGFTQEIQESTQGATSYNYNSISFFPCFSWTVQSVCEDGSISDPAPLMCYAAFTGECNEAPEFNDEEDSRNKLHLVPIIYPNPASGSINFELKAPESLTITTEIYGLDGKLVKSFVEETYRDGFFKKQWRIEERIKDGIYFVIFKTNTGTFQEKIVISKGTDFNN